MRSDRPARDPRDHKGKTLKVGDTVIIRAKVISLYEGDDFTNVVCETLEPLTEGAPHVPITLNTQQVEKVKG